MIAGFASPLPEPEAAAPAGAGAVEPERGAGRAPAGGAVFGAPSAPVGFHALDTQKLLLMSVLSLGLYQIYWAYRCWTRHRAGSGEALRPFWRAVLGPFWGFVLFQQISDSAEGAGMKVAWRSPALGGAYLLFHLVWLLPSPFWLLGLLSVLPLVAVQRSINELAQLRGVEADRSYDSRHFAVMLPGALLLLFAVKKVVFPEA